MAVKHLKVSTILDGVNNDLVRPSDWNAEHTVEDNTVTDAKVAAHTTTKITVPTTQVSGVISDPQHGSRTVANAHRHTDLTDVAADQHHSQVHTHESSPGQGGLLDEDALALTDVVTNNASITKHGFLPKLSGDITQFLDGTGIFSVPAGGGGGGIDQAASLRLISMRG